MTTFAAGRAWIGMKRLLSVRLVVIMGVLLCAVVVIKVRIAVPEVEHGWTVYSRVMGPGTWSSQRITWADQRGFIGALADRFRTCFGLPAKTYPITRHDGEKHHVPPIEVPYLAVPQLARFLPPDLGWSIQIRVFDEPRRMRNASGTSAISSGARGRLWKGEVIRGHADNPDDFRWTTFMLDMEDDDDNGTVDITTPRIADFRRYRILIDDHDHVFDITRHDIHGTTDTSVNPDATDVH